MFCMKGFGQFYALSKFLVQHADNIGSFTILNNLYV